MNFELLKGVTKIKPGARTLFIYVPSIVSSGIGLAPGTVVRVLDVYDVTGNYEDVSLRVIQESAYQQHCYGTNCTRYDSERTSPCTCMDSTQDMGETLKQNVFHVLLSDLRR
jgi:hypothetical protein